LGLSFLSKKENTGSKEWTIRPVEKELIIDRLRVDKTKRSLKLDYIANELVEQEFFYGIQRRAMTVVEILGIPGVGKSVLALTFARHLQILWANKLNEMWDEDPENFAEITESRDENGKPKFYRPMIRIGFNMTQTTEHVKAARMGDVVIQDEDPKLAGYEVRSVQHQIENLLKIMRQACVNLIFVSPIQVSYVATPTFVLEAIAQDIEKRLTAAALYDRQHNAHGWCIVEVLPEEDPLMVFYLKKKTENIKNLKAASGKESVMYSAEALGEDTTKLYKFLLGMGYDPIKRKPSLDFLQSMCLFAGIKGSTRYDLAVAHQLLNLLEAAKLAELESGGKRKEEEPMSLLSTDGEFVIELENVIMDADILQVIYDCTEEALADRKDRGEKVEHYQPKHGEAWMYVYVKGYTMQATADALSHHQDDGHLSDTAIANRYKEGGWRAIYQEEISGEAAELAIKRKYLPEEEWEHVGGFGKPDIANKKDDTWIEIKIRDRLKPKEPIESQIANFEYEHVREGKIVRVIRIGYRPKEARIEFWKVSLNPDWVKNKVAENPKEESIEDKEE